MKGTLIHNDKGWFISHNDNEMGTFIIDVRPGRIEDLNKVGTYLKVGSEVDFVMEEIHSFPYRYAVPIININTVTTDEPQSISSMYIPPKKTKKQYKITLWLVGFPDDEVEVICDAWDCSSSGYFYFYDIDKQTDKRKYLCLYPIERTAFHEFEEIETEY
jgi:hypothetical protein